MPALDRPPGDLQGTHISAGLVRSNDSGLAITLDGRTAPGCDARVAIPPPQCFFKAGTCQFFARGAVPKRHVRAHASCRPPAALGASTQAPMIQHWRGAAGTQACTCRQAAGGNTRASLPLFVSCQARPDADSHQRLSYSCYFLPVGVTPTRAVAPAHVLGGARGFAAL
jgi:hypothetical protein